MPDNVKDNVAVAGELRSIYEELNKLLDKHETALRGMATLGSNVYAVNKALLASQLKNLEVTKQWYSVEEKIEKNQKDQVILRQELAELIASGAANEYAVAGYMDRINGLVAERLRLQDQFNRKKGFETFLTNIGLDGLHKSYNWTSKLLATGNLLTISTGIFVKLLTYSLEVFKEMDDAAAKFRMHMGLTRNATGQIDKDAREIAFNLAHVGVNAEIAYAAFSSTADVLGSVRYATKGMAEDMALMQAQLGVATETSAQFLQTMGMVGRTTAGAQKDIALFTSQLSEAAGTNLKQVMGDVATAAKSGYVFLSRNPAALAKAAVQAKLLGTSLDQITTSAESLVDFTNSIASEMEASVLAGESINLQRARELAYSKDLKGLNTELLRLAEKHKFEQMDPFQQKAFAKALGVSASEMGKMVQSSRERRSMESEIWAKGTPAEKAKLQRLKDMEKASAAVVKNTAEEAKKQLSILANQSRITSITNSWKAITQRLAQFVLPLIDGALKGIAYAMGWINKNWGIFVAAAAFGIQMLVGGIILITMLILKLGSIAGIALGKGISAALRGVAAGLQVLGASAANPITWVGIAAILALGAAFLMMAYGISLIVRELPKAAQGFSIFAEAITKMGWGEIAKMGAMVPVLFALGPALLAFAVGAVAGGGAMGLLARGFSAIGSGLASLVSPNLGGTIGQMNLLAEAVRNLNKALNDIPTIKIAAISAMQFASALGAAPAPKPAETTGWQEVKAEISLLRQDLARGGIPANVTVDGQLLTSTLDRQTQFRNGYGTNNAKLATT